MIELDLSDKRVLVTGAASGIGLAVSRLFARAGATVVLADLDAAPLEAIAREFDASGHACAVEQLNVTSSAEVEEAIRRHRPDVLVTSAGILTAGSLHEVEDEEWERQFAVNVFGTANCCRAFIRERLRSGSEGAIVCLASVGGIVGDPGYAAYCASKGAVITLVRQLAVDYAKSGIRVNAVAPGFTKTAMSGVHDEHRAAIFTEAIPRGQWATPEEIADGVLFLSSGLASHVHGQTLAIDGGRLAGNPYPRLHAPIEA